jgi:hypothetical protein
MGDLIAQAHRRSGKTPRLTGASRRAKKHTARSRSSPAPSRRPRPRAV